MLQPIVHGHKLVILIHYVEQIVLKMLLDGTTFWQATIVPMWDPTDHLNLETTGQMLMNLSACSAMPSVLSVLVIIMDNVKLASMGITMIHS